MPNIKIVSTTPGTAVPISTKDLYVWTFVAQALRNNTDVICVGGPDTNATTHIGLELAAGDAKDWVPIQQFYNLAHFYVDTKVSGEGVNIVYPD